MKLPTALQRARQATNAYILTCIFCGYPHRTPYDDIYGKPCTMRELIDHFATHHGRVL